MSAIWVVLAVVNATGWLLPDPADKLGWGLRVRLSRVGPILQHERLDQVPIDLTLINYSKEPREHDVFIVASATGDLTFGVLGPDGKGWPRHAGGYSSPRDPFTVMNKLRPGECYRDHFEGFGVWFLRLHQAGRYRIVATMKIDGKELRSPPVELEVVKVEDDAVLVSHNLLRQDVKPQPGEHRMRAAVEQVRVGDRVWLVYRQWGTLGGLIFARRLAELPGKCEMTVEGVYGESGPLRITYKTSPAAQPTKLAIQSSGGSPWGEEEERTWQEKLRAKNGLPPPGPPPRPVKP